MKPSYPTILADVLLEKKESFLSKLRDETATEADKCNLAFVEEVLALAGNRLAADRNAASQSSNPDVWVERADAHYPHIRLHGGAREDDIPNG
jgi:hypothetical protein